MTCLMLVYCRELNCWEIFDCASVCVKFKFRIIDVQEVRDSIAKKTKTSKSFGNDNLGATLWILLFRMRLSWSKRDQPFAKARNRAARIVTGSRFDAPGQQLVKKLCRRTIDELLTSGFNMMVFKFLHGLAPQYMYDHFTKTS